MGYILHKGTTGRRGGEAYEAADRDIKSTLLRTVGLEQSGMGCLAMGLWGLPRRFAPRNDVKRAGLEAVGYAD